MTYPKDDPEVEIKCSNCGRIRKTTHGRVREAKRKMRLGMVCGRRCAGRLGGLTKATNFWDDTPSKQ